MVITTMKRFSVHYTFVLILILAFFVGLIKEIALILFVLLLHELGHLFFILIFKYKIEKITIYPFGGVIKFCNKNDFLYKNYLIILGGVISNFIFFLFFRLLNLLTLSNINLYFIILNIIPIFPLDGGRIFILFLSSFLPLKLSKILGYVVSLILAISLFIFLYINFYGIYIYVFLIFFIRINVASLLFLEKDYHVFLLSKYLNPNSSLKNKVTKFWNYSPLNNLFNGKNTIYDFESFKVEEMQILKMHFEKKKRLN